jgi:hypothetical protein
MLAWHSALENAAEAEAKAEKAGRKSKPSAG